MREVEIVDPEPFYEVVFGPGGLWIAPQAWKTP
jgi:hypothetical protein